MKKTFKLSDEKKNKDRLLESIKHNIRKYIKREKNKKLPDDVDYWDLQCKFAKNDEEPYTIQFIDIIKKVDEASNENCESFYMEIISVNGHRKFEKREVETQESE